MAAHFITRIPSKDADGAHMVKRSLVTRLKHRTAVFETAHKQVLHPLELAQAYLLPFGQVYCSNVNTAVCFSWNRYTYVKNLFFPNTNIHRFRLFRARQTDFVYTMKCMLMP